MTETPRIVGCTAVTASYAAYARVLAAHWLELQPQLPLCVLLLDGDPAALAIDGIRVVTAEELGLSPLELQIRRGIYGPGELSNSLKADLLRMLIAEGYDAAVYIDPDTGMYGNIDDVGAAAAEHGVALSPQLLRPLPPDGLYPDELDILTHGVFNGGLIAVGRGAELFLNWWSELLRRDCLHDTESGLHADQRWLQSVPLYFPYTFLTDPTLHVAQWNVHERNLEWVEGRYLVDGRPLRTFHFSQFDPEHPDRLWRWQTAARPPRVDPSSNPAVFRLLREYAAELMEAGYREDQALGYAYAESASGRPLGRWERGVYREVVLAREAGGEFPLPNPFDPADSLAFERLIGRSAADYPLSPQAVWRIRNSRRVRRAPSGRADALAARARDFLLYWFVGREYGFRPPSNRTAFEYERERPVE